MTNVALLLLPLLVAVAAVWALIDWHRKGPQK